MEQLACDDNSCLRNADAAQIASIAEFTAYNAMVYIINNYPLALTLLFIKTISVCSMYCFSKKCLQ